MEEATPMCRVCMAQGKDEKLVPVLDRIAKEIFLICGVRVLEFDSFGQPSLICAACTKDLARAIRFRSKCRKTEEFLKKSMTEAGSSCQDGYSVQHETATSATAIKEEPFDECSYSLESSEHRRMLMEAKHKASLSDISNSGSELNESFHRKRLNETFVEEHGISNQLVECNLCFKSFTSLHSMKDHMRSVHQKLEEAEMFKCPHCERLFKMKYYLNRHIKNYHLKQNQSVVPRSNAKPASRIDGDEIFKKKLFGLNCPYCNKFLTSKHSLSDHIRVRHEFINFSERFLCDICGKDFPLKYYLLRHIRASHLKTLSYKKKVEDHLPCCVCGKILKSKGNLSTHEKTHKTLTPDEYYYCDICGNKFKSRGEMTVHIKKRHLFKIRYHCEICPAGKSWRTLFQLQRHVKVFHQNIREFKCEWCGKEFGEKNKLVCHLRIHTGEQPFKCSNFAGCNRAFTHQTDLRRHIWGHTGIRPYKCKREECSKGFMKKSELTAHEARCHNAANKSMIPFQY